MVGHASSLPGPLGLGAGGHTEREYLNELEQWMDGLAILPSKL